MAPLYSPWGVRGVREGYTPDPGVCGWKLPDLELSSGGLMRVRGFGVL